MSIRKSYENLRHVFFFSKNFRGADGEIVQSRIARSDCAIGIGDSDDGLFKIAVAKTDSAKHGTVWSALDAVRNRAASAIQTIHLLLVVIAVAATSSDVGRSVDTVTGSRNGIFARSCDPISSIN